MSQEIIWPLKFTERDLIFSYKNYRDETSIRRVTPLAVWYGVTEWHPEMQFFLRAVDREKNAMRDFAMSDISGVTYDDGEFVAI